MDGQIALTRAWLRAHIQLRAHIRSEAGASLVEYALIIALIAIVCVAAVGTFGSHTKSAFNSLATGY